MTSTLQPALHARLGLLAPISAVIPGSTQVLAFGDPTTAKVATIGLNPSKVEFLDKRGKLLTGAERRLATAESLGDLTGEDAHRRVVEDCNGYFRRAPYMRWFGQLDELMQPLGASYLAGSACHLDLSPWATDPVWGELPANQRQRLVEDGLPFLDWQLKTHPLRLALVNGRGVIDALTTAGVASRESAWSFSVGSVSTTVSVGRIGRIPLISWSTNLQSSWGVSTAFRTGLAQHVRKLAEELGYSVPDAQGTA